MSKWTIEDIERKGLKLSNSTDLEKSVITPTTNKPASFALGRVNNTIKIGIDPDVEASGVAIIDYDNNCKMYLILENMPLLRLYWYLKNVINRNEKVIVYIEAGHLINYNYTAMQKAGANIGTLLKTANAVGANNEIGRQIEKICLWLKIEYKLIKPLKKVWGLDSKGKPKKIDHKQFMSLWAIKKLGFNSKQTNQEQRDAALLIL